MTLTPADLQALIAHCAAHGVTNLRIGDIAVRFKGYVKAAQASDALAEAFEAQQEAVDAWMTSSPAPTEFSDVPPDEAE